MALEDRYQRIPFDEAIDFLRQKIDVDTDSSYDILDAQHDAAFVVAGAKGAVLSELREAVTRAMTEGQRLEDFQAKFEEIAEGWEHKGDAAWRSRVIYQTNIRQAHAAGRYQQQLDPEVLRVKPYLQCIHGGSAHPRPSHLALHEKVFPALECPIFFPSGYGCSCRTVSLSDRDLSRFGLEVSRIARGDTVPVTVDGKTYDAVIEPDPGFDKIPGQSSDEQREEMRRQMLPRMSPEIREQVEAELNRIDEAIAQEREETPRTEPTEPIERVATPPAEARPDFSISNLVEYADRRIQIINNEFLGAHNQTFEEWRNNNPDGSDKAALTRYKNEQRDAIGLRFVTPEALQSSGLKLRKTDQSRNQEQEELYTNAKAATEEIDRLLNRSLVPDNLRENYRPMMTAEEAAEYTAGTYFEGIDLYHGSTAEGVENITSQGVDPGRNTDGIYGAGFYQAILQEEASIYAQDGAGQVVTSRTYSQNPFVVRDSSEIRALADRILDQLVEELELEPQDLEELFAGMGDPSNAGLSLLLRVQGYDSIYIQDKGYQVAFQREQVLVYEANAADAGDTSIPSHERIQQAQGRSRNFQELGGG